MTTFLLQQEIDTGNILLAQRIAIPPTYTAGDLHDKLMEVGSKLLVDTVNAVEVNQITAKPQSDLIATELLKHAPKIFKEDCKIEWNRPVEQVYNHIKGLSPYPTAFTFFQDKTLKLFRVELDKTSPEVVPGSVVTDHKMELKFACQDGFIIVKELQLEGKKRLLIEDFLRGTRL